MQIKLVIISNNVTNSQSVYNKSEPLPTAQYKIQIISIILLEIEINAKIVFFVITDNKL